MINLTHDGWFKKLFGKGVNTDIEKELLPEGVAHN